MGYTYKTKGGKIKVTKGSLIVIKAAIKDGLYKMIRETEIKDQAASLMAEMDRVALWHTRLAHSLGTYGRKGPACSQQGWSTWW